MKLPILLSLLLLINNAYSFTSVIGNQPRRGYDIHSQISYSVLDKLGFSYISFREIISGNVSNDFYRNLVLDASRHCDRNFKISHRIALENCRSSFHFLLKDSIKEAKEKNYLRALYRIGQALHVAQDLLSHSNIILLPNKNKEEIIDYFLSAKKQTIPNIDGFKLTYWEENDMKNHERKDPFSHIEYSLDHPKLNSWSKKKNNKNITYFELAFKEAEVITGRVMNLFLAELSKEQKTMIKTYNR